MKNDKAVKIMIKTQVLLWKTIEGNRGLGLELSFFYFILNPAPLTHDVACSRFYLDGKNMRRQCQMSSLDLSIFQSWYVVQASFPTDTTIIFKIFKKICDWFIFPNSYFHYKKYRNLLLFPVNGGLLGTTLYIWY